MENKEFEELLKISTLPKYLREDPEWLDGYKVMMKEHYASILKDREDAAPLLEDLAKHGFVVKHPAVLYLEKMYYKDAIPILLKWLPKINNRSIKDSIIRTFCAPWAFPDAWTPLVEAFKTLKDIHSDLRWSIGNSLGSIANESVFEDVLCLAKDKQYGTQRMMLVRALGKMKNPRAVDALMELLDDKDVDLSAIYALGKLKAVKARSKIEPFLFHQDSDYRKEAKSALAKIDRYEQKKASAK